MVDGVCDIDIKMFLVKYRIVLYIYTKRNGIVGIHETANVINFDVSLWRSRFAEILHQQCDMAEITSYNVMLFKTRRGDMWIHLDT